MTATITLHDTDTYLIDTLTHLSGGTTRPTADDTTITLTPTDLDRLAGLPDDCDGHYDGTYIWIGGTAYPVVADRPNISDLATTRDLAAGTRADAADDAATRPTTSTPAAPAAQRWEQYRAAVAAAHAAYDTAVTAVTAVPPTPGDTRVLTEDEQDATQAASWAAQSAAIVAAQQARDTAIAAAAEQWIPPQSYCIVSDGDGLSNWSTTFAEPPTSDRPGHWTGTGPDGLPSHHHSIQGHAPVVERTPVIAAPRYRRGQRVLDITPGYTGRGDIADIRWTPDGWYYMLQERGLWTYPSDVHWAYEGSLKEAS